MRKGYTFFLYPCTQSSQHHLLEVFFFLPWNTCQKSVDHNRVEWSICPSLRQHDTVLTWRSMSPPTLPYFKIVLILQTPKSESPSLFGWLFFQVKNMFSNKMACSTLNSMTRVLSLKTTLVFCVTVCSRVLTSHFITQSVKGLIQGSRFNKINKFYCLLQHSLEKLVVVIVVMCVCQWRTQWIPVIVHFGVTAWTPVKAPAALPTIDFALFMQMPSFLTFKIQNFKNFFKKFLHVGDTFTGLITSVKIC